MAGLNYPWTGLLQLITFKVFAHLPHQKPGDNSPWGWRIFWFENVQPFGQQLPSQKAGGLGHLAKLLWRQISTGRRKIQKLLCQFGPYGENPCKKATDFMCASFDIAILFPACASAC